MQAWNNIIEDDFNKLLSITLLTKCVFFLAAENIPTLYLSQLDCNTCVTSDLREKSLESVSDCKNTKKTCAIVISLTDQIRNSKTLRYS